MGYFRGGLSAPRRSSYKPPAVHAEEVGIKELVLGSLNLGRSSRDEAYEKIVIRIRSEYHQRFLDALNEARRKYKKQSKLEITIEEDIMRIYQTLIRQRADINGIKYSLRGLLELREMDALLEAALARLRDIMSRLFHLQRHQGD